MLNDSVTVSWIFKNLHLAALLTISHSAFQQRKGNTLTFILKPQTRRLGVLTNLMPNLHVFVSLSGLQELEMQARAHGLAIASSALCSAEIGVRTIKQEPALEDCHQDLYTLHPHHQQHPACTPETPSNLELNEGHSNFSEGHYGVHSKSGSKLSDILMEDTLSPVRGGDPLLSSVSPDTSKDSSCKSSVSMDENEGC